MIKKTNNNDMLTVLFIFQVLAVLAHFLAGILRFASPRNRSAIVIRTVPMEKTSTGKHAVN